MAKQKLEETSTPLGETQAPQTSKAPEQSIDMEFVKELKNQLDKMKEQNEVLMAVADKKSLTNYYQKTRKGMPTVIRLRTFEGLAVTSWKTIKDEVFQDPITRAWRENQVVEIELEDGTKKELPLIEFVRKYQYVDTKKVGEVTDEDNVFVKLLRLDNGKELTINILYVN